MYCWVVGTLKKIVRAQKHISTKTKDIKRHTHNPFFLQLKKKKKLYELLQLYLTRFHILTLHDSIFVDNVKYSLGYSKQIRRANTEICALVLNAKFARDAREKDSDRLRNERTKREHKG